MNSEDKFLLTVGAGWVGFVFIATATISFIAWSAWKILTLYSFLYMLLFVVVIGILLLTPAVISHVKNKNE